MPILLTYKGALKLGQNEFRAAMSKGEHPYPPVLNEFVPDGRINRGQDLGYTHIPLEFVVGTRTSGRTYAFARNFMPIMKESTEFATKWTALCQSQTQEGIREPILAYEFLNRYYVQEGNKRVSVLKFCGADTVYAHVIRVLPEPGESGRQEEELYAELTDFIKYSGVNYLELSKPGYTRLQQLVGKKPEERWTDEDRKEFSSIYYHFRKAYGALGGNKLTSTRGDALEAGPSEALEQAIADGNTIIFTTSSSLQPAALRCAVEHPNVTILNCTQISPHRYIRTYYIRHYEAKFILGAIAGALARSDKIGYVGYLSGKVDDEQMNKVHTASDIAGVNAFALGAQMVNPWAKVYLEWFDGEDLPGVSRRLRDKGIQLISLPDYMRYIDGDFGLCQFTDEGSVTLAFPVVDWGVYYETLLRRILNKSLQSEYEKNDRAVNYYWGMSAGVVRVECFSDLPECTRNLAELLQDNIRRGLSHPFKGKIHPLTSGEMDGELTMDFIMGMDWLADNIEGVLPDIH